MKGRNLEIRESPQPGRSYPKKIERSEQPPAELPVLSYATEIKDALRRHDNVLIVGETGCGKTTQIPLMLREIFPPPEKIAITQPRRLATRSVAKYVAKQVGCTIGEEVGYQIRFEDRTTEGTHITFMTDGILLRKLQEDPLLKEYGVVMVDEAHERSLNIDFVLGLLKHLQKERARANLPPLKIVVTSATLEKEKFANYFGECPTVEVPGRLHPITIHYEKERVYDYIKAAAEKAKMIIEEKKKGDILIFMPGQEEINKTIQKINEFKIEGIVLFPLYGEMTPEDQDKIFEKTNAQKVIISTNIAETSVTVPGIRYVIDSGLIKQIEFNPSTGIEMLVLRSHAQSGCIQRAGRAGREAPGECWRLYTENDFNERPPFQEPEIKRSNLAHVVLLMKKIGIEDIKSFEFIDAPDPGSFQQAIETLKRLGALDENEKITPLGELMAELPLEPHIARMVLEAEKYNCVEAICTIASFLGGRSVFVRPQGQEEKADKAHQEFSAGLFSSPNIYSDFLVLLRVWQEYEANHFSSEWARSKFLNPRVLEEVKQIRYQLFRILRRNGVPVSESQDPETIGKSITAGLIENLMKNEGGYSYVRKNVKEKEEKEEIYIHPSSVAFHRLPFLLVAAEIFKTRKTYARLIQEVDPKWIKEIAPYLTEEVITIYPYYSPDKDQILRRVKFRLKDSYITTTEETQVVTGEIATRTFAEALAENKVKLDVIGYNNLVVEEVNKLWYKSEGKFRRSPLFRRDFISFYLQRLGQISSRRELEEALKKGEIDLELDIDNFISAEEREKINRENPDSIKILDKEFPISYTYDNKEEKFVALIQVSPDELFKINETPVLPSGRILALEVATKFEKYIGTNLEELKKEVRKKVLIEQWQQAYNSGKIPPEKLLPDFNLLDEWPSLPPPISYGKDPLTNTELVAYPAIAESAPSRYKIRYYPSQEEAKRAQQELLEKRENALQQKSLKIDTNN